MLICWWLVGVQMFDRWRVQRARVKQGLAAAHPWEGKGGLLYHIDLGLDLVIRVPASVQLAVQSHQASSNCLWSSSHCPVCMLYAMRRVMLL